MTKKGKFKLLSYLIKELCSYQNSKLRFNNISSLIILFLNLYKKNYPLDICSNDENKPSKLAGENSSEFKRIIRSELLINS